MNECMIEKVQKEVDWMELTTSVPTQYMYPEM